MKLILATLGALLVIEGLPYLLFPGKVKEWSQSVQDANSRGMRIMALVTVLAGTIIFYLVFFLK